MKIRIHREVLFLALAVLLGSGMLTGARAQTPTATPNGQYLCSAGPRDGQACNADEDCAPTGVCVIAQGICNGGTDDGDYCGCVSGTCTASSPACDPSFTGTCVGGANADFCCDVTNNPTGGYVANCSGAICTGSQKICLAGTFKGQSCLNDAQCPGTVCQSTGKFCCGGTDDSFSCVDSLDCAGGGVCDGANSSCGAASPTPTNTFTPTRTRTAATVGPTATRTPTRTPPSGTVGPSNTPTPTSATPPPTTATPVNATATPTPLAIVPKLTRAITASDLTIPLDDASDLPSSGIIQIDNEQISYLGKFHNSLTGVRRGVDGSTAESHARGATVLLIAGPPTPTPSAFPTSTIAVPQVEAVGNGSGCSLTGAAENAGGVGLIGVALALSALRRKRRK